MLTPNVRSELKNPLGLLIRGSFRYTTERLAKLIDETKPKKLIAVGDSVSKNIVEKGLSPDVLIVDNKIMRKPIRPIEFKVDKTLHLRNPAGTLANEAWQVMKEAIDYSGKVKVLVEGEEDLLTLVAVLLATVNSIVVYGQPREGMVVIKVTDDMKRKVHDMVERMESKFSKD